MTKAELYAAMFKILGLHQTLNMIPLLTNDDYLTLPKMKRPHKWRQHKNLIRPKNEEDLKNENNSMLFFFLLGEVWVFFNKIYSLKKKTIVF